MKIIVLLFLLLNYISVIYTDSQPSTLTLEGFIYDQYPEYNDNFEPPTGSLTEGMVLANINSSTRVPELVSLLQYTTVNQNGRIQSPNLFQYFYQSNTGASKTSDSGLNVPMTIKLNLTLDSSRGVYVYDDQTFFPIDYMGFDVDASYRKYSDGKNYHNFHFCLKINSKFTYQGIEVFNFVGDDDVWVFINDYLVIDLGGLHTASSKSVDLTKLKINGNSLVKGDTYNFDFFYCERHSTQSTIRIETNIQTFCPTYDYCGVCRGDGSSCCSSTLCDDGNPCTDDECPPEDTVIQSGYTIKDYCQHIPKSCAVIDKCSNNTCSMSSGECVQTTVPCPSKSSQCLTLNKCDASQGCLYESSCNGICNTGVCNSGTCAIKTSSMCASELDNDKCKVYSCDPVKGCVSEPLCKQGSNPCIVASCNNGVCSNTTLSASECQCCDGKLNACEKNNCINGECVPLRIDIDDGNQCTIDICNNSTGIITHEPVTTCTGCMTCNVKTGLCDSTSSLCSDGNECTDNICVADSTNSNYGICESSIKSCNSTDKCLVWNCDSDSGCQSSPRVCPDSGKCQVGYCDSIEGCLLKPRSCNTTNAYCLVSECDDSLGCITYDRRCAVDNAHCQQGICLNATATEAGKCVSKDYDPKPFICKTAAVVSTAVAAGIAVAGAVALAAFIYGGKKGYETWRQNRDVKFTNSSSNPLYVQSQNSGNNPLYNDSEAGAN